MASIKIGCPKCLSTGLTGTVIEVVCSECAGTGLISANDTDTIATANTNSKAASGGVAVIVMAPVAIPPAALKVASKGK